MRVGQVILLKNEGGSGHFFFKNEGGWKHFNFLLWVVGLIQKNSKWWVVGLPHNLKWWVVPPHTHSNCWNSPYFYQSEVDNYIHECMEKENIYPLVCDRFL